MSEHPQPEQAPAAANTASSATNSWRLAVGTWTSIRIGPPTEVTSSIAGRAMALGPVLGIALGVVVAAVAGLPLLFSHTAANSTPVTIRLLSATIALAALAWLTRALHLDGLADTADGFGSGRTGQAALDVMRKSDIGPFGVTTLVLVLSIDVFSIASINGSITGLSLVVSAVVTGRLAAMRLCVEGNVAASARGLGATVVGSVAPLTATVMTVIAVGACAGLVAIGLVLDTTFAWQHPSTYAAFAALLIGVSAGGIVTVLLQRRATARFGGLNGDVLGAGVELATVSLLLVAALGLSH